MFRKPSAPPPPPPAQKPPAAPPPAPAPTPAPAAALPNGWKVRAFTASHVVTGILPPPSMPLLGALNITNQLTVTLKAATLLSVDAPAAPELSAAEAVLPKPMVCVFAPLDEASAQSAVIQLASRSALVRLFAPPFVVQGELRLPGDMPLGNLFGVMGEAQFFALSQARVFSTAPGLKLPDTTFPAVFVHRARVTVYHPV